MLVIQEGKDETGRFVDLTVSDIQRYDAILFGSSTYVACRCITALVLMFTRNHQNITHE